MSRGIAGPGKKMGRPPVDPIERFLAKVEQGDGCWLWQASVTTSGYGQFSYPVDGVRRQGLAHRFAYEHFIGPIPDGLQIDHLCRVRLCVIPLHLEAVTPLENVHRADVALGRGSAKTHCPQGHPYDEANTRRNPQGRRLCKACGRDWYHRHKQPKVRA